MAHLSHAALAQVSTTAAAAAAAAAVAATAATTTITTTTTTTAITTAANIRRSPRPVHGGLLPSLARRLSRSRPLCLAPR